MTDLAFIVGAPRSGTTLLRRMLDSHSLVAGPHEYPLIGTAIEYFRTRGLEEAGGFLDLIYSSPRFSAWGVKREVLEAGVVEGVRSAKELVEHILDSYLAERSANVFVDKNIGNIASLVPLRSMFPEAKFIHIIRDGRDVALSLRDRKWNSYQFGTFPRRDIRHLKGGALVWLDAFELVDAFVRCYEPAYLQIKYEELAIAPEKTLARVCAFLGLDFERNMLAFHSRPDPTMSKKSGKLNHELLGREVTSTRVERYRSSLCAGEISALNSLLEDHLKVLGYAVGRARSSFLFDAGYAARHWLEAPLLKARASVSRLFK